MYVSMMRMGEAATSAGVEGWTPHNDTRRRHFADLDEVGAVAVAAGLVLLLLAAEGALDVAVLLICVDGWGVCRRAR